MNENSEIGNSKLSIKHEKIASSVLNVLVNSIPVIGPAVFEGLFNYWNNVKQERVNLFVEKLKEHCDNLVKEEIDEEFLRQEDFSRFFELILRKVSETKSNAKLNLFRDIVVNNIKTKSISDFSETFLTLISQLSEKQIEILRMASEINISSEDRYENIIQLEEKINSHKEKLVIERNLKHRGKANNSSKISKELEELEMLYKSISAELRKAEVQISNNIKEINNPEYQVYVQDCILKGLLTEYTPKPKFIKFQILTLTKFGKLFMEFIRMS